MKKLNFLFVLITIISLGITGIIFLCSPNIKYSIAEGRNLTEKPKLNWNSNQSMKTLENYYKDHILFRNTLLEKGTNIKRNLGIEIQNDVYLGKEEYLFEVPKKNHNSNQNSIEINNEEQQLSKKKKPNQSSIEIDNEEQKLSKKKKPHQSSIEFDNEESQFSKKNKQNV